jgi:DeoR family fructose operon transcriptional repressor
MKTPDNALQYAEERKNRILEIVRQKKKVSVEELGALFRVTGATVRTYLRELQHAGLLVRTHGGAILKTHLGFEPDSMEKSVQNLEAKRRIARAALKLIEDNDRILLDTGTTTLELARLLNARNNLTVTTNDIEIARTLEGFEGVSVVLIGGILRKRFHCTVGSLAVDMLSGLKVDKAFMAANGFSLADGAMTPDSEQAALKRGMAKAAHRVVLLCDVSKLGRPSFAKFADARDIDTLVMNGLDAKKKKTLVLQGLTVIDC